jgi:fatty acid desaturase
LPAVPYYRLPEAHRMLQRQQVFQDNATICSSYFSGVESVTMAWQGQGHIR